MSNEKLSAIMSGANANSAANSTAAKPSKTTKQRERTWIKNHPLEGDGLVTGFYNFLHKRNTKTMKPCKDVFIPDTIVFDHNFPRGWYTSDLKAKEISKRQGKELDAASIANGFSKPSNPNVNIVASYMCTHEVEDPTTGESEMFTQVEFFNEYTLHEFVSRKVKKEGILQKFLVPKGHRNSVIQAVWSPRVCIVQRRTNIGSILDKLQCERDPYPVAVTYEGPSHFSEEGTCAGHTTEEIKTICGNIVSHFYSTEHKIITRMVLYFKVDDKDQVWLLWCGSLRVSDRDAPSMMPLNLAPKFDSPALEATSPQKEDALLYEADMRHLEMTNDTLFYTTYVKDKTSSGGDKSPRSAHGHHNADDGAGGSGGGAGTGGGSGGNGGSSGGNSGAGGKNSSGAHGDMSNGADADGEGWWRKKAPEVQDQYRELCLDRDFVLSALDDLFYEAYGHFLRHDPGPYNFEVDRKVAQTLGVDVLQELMHSLKIENAPPSDDTGAVDDEELYFTIPAARHGPIARMGDEAARWVRQHYRKLETELKNDAKDMPDADEVHDEPAATEHDETDAEDPSPVKKQPTEPAPAPAPAQAAPAAADSNAAAAPAAPAPQSTA